MNDSATINDPLVLSPVEIKLDTKFRREYPIAWWSTLVGPFLVSFLILAIVWETSLLSVTTF